MGFGISEATVRTVVQEEVAAIKAQAAKLAGETPGESSVTALWNSGVATSTEAGADLVSIGAAGDRKKLNSLQVDISQLTIGAIIDIRLYELVNGTERKIYPPDGTEWVVGTDPDAIWVIDGPVEITGVVRVEVYSDQAGDDGLAIAYKYALEDM